MALVLGSKGSGSPEVFAAAGLNALFGRSWSLVGFGILALSPLSGSRTSTLHRLVMLPWLTQKHGMAPEAQYPNTTFLEDEMYQGRVPGSITMMQRLKG